MANASAEYEFRAYTEDESSDFDSLTRYVFAGEEPDADNPPLIRPEWSQCAFAGETIAACGAAFPFVVRMNGRTLTMHGVTAIGTDPAHRRRGLVRHIITDLLHRAESEGCAGTILLASMGAIYQRFGYGLASRYTGYRFEPHMAALEQQHEPTGTVRRLPLVDALPIVKQVFGEYVKDKNMMALRADVTWGLLLGLNQKQKPHFVAHYDDAGVPDAYCVYTTKIGDPREDAGPDQELSILDFYYSSMSGYRSIWNYILGHDLVRWVNWDNVPEDDPAPGILAEPRAVNARTGDGLWLRVVNAERMLAGRGYDSDGEVVVRLTGDDLCPWNNDTYKVRVTDGKAEVTRTGESPDLTCGAQGIASLLSGFGSVGWLARNERITVADDARIREFDHLFSTRYRPHLSFGF